MQFCDRAWLIQADAILGNPCLRRESLIPDLSRAEELRPYRRLDPDRLKLHFMEGQIGTQFPKLGTS